MPEAAPTVADPFDLPEWIGTHACTWTTRGSVGDVRVAGLLSGTDGAGATASTEPLAVSVLAADVAYPRPVVDDQVRHDVHQAWVHGQVLLLDDAGDLVVAVPGTTLGVDSLCEAVRRFARAVGAEPERFTVALRL